MKYPFDRMGRLVIHQIHDGRCWICGQYVQLPDLKVDHVVPKSLANNLTQLEEAKTTLQLPPSFDFDAVENCLPSHERCNREKTNKVHFYWLRLALDRAVDRSGAVRARYEQLRELRELEEVIVKLENHIDRGRLSPEERELLGEHLDRWDRVEFERTLDPRWRVISRVGKSMAFVGAPYGRGYVYLGLNRNSEFRCGSCGAYGPWEGARCGTCGMLSDPGD
jgi:hypothetical protein